MGSTSADNTGVLSGAYVTVPQAVRGNHQIRATDNTGITFQSSFNINSKISVTPVTASVGSTITISGTGFVANAQPTFYLDDVVFPAVGTGDNFGNIQATVIVPAVSGGNHSLKVQDSGSSATASLSVTAIISLTPSNGAANSPVTVTGKGFGANKPVTLTWKGLPISSNPASLSSDNNGAFTATVTAPVGQAGSYTISASDGTLSASADFSMTASITPSVSTGEVGGNITIGGIGFNPSAPVTIKFDNVQIATAIADTTGAFSTTIVVPPSIAGSHTITASDTIITTSPINISVTSSTSLSIVSGYVGSDITVKGSGFSAGSAGKTVTIKYDDIFNTTTTSDTSGSFSITFKAPASKGGNHTITATDGTYTTKNNYAMDSTLPPVPANLLPENKSNADALTKFTWAPSNDPSGVIYELQVATDAGFGALIVDKKDLATPGYQTTEAEKFKTTGGDAPYYWRVRAIDGAGNASDWTNPQTFSVGFIFPTWGIYVIFVLLIVLAAAGGFWFGRRTSFKWDW